MNTQKKSTLIKILSYAIFLLSTVMTAVPSLNDERVIKLVEIASELIIESVTVALKEKSN
jgi:uncharacterized membrane protein